MAIDTDTRKFSAMWIGLPWRGIHSIPAGVLDEPEWFSLLGLYNEFAAEDEVQVLVPDVDDAGTRYEIAVIAIEAVGLLAAGGDSRFA